MTAASIAFWLLAVTAIVAGWRVFRTGSMVRAAFFLLASFVAVGGIMLLLSAAYLGFATIFMMAVEMMVMAVFMVMFMMNPAGLNPMSMVHQRTVAIVAGAVAFAGLAAVALVTDFPAQRVGGDADVIATLGTELLGPSMLVFESAGVALLATMLGTVILSSRSGRYGPADEGSEPPGLAPGEPPAGGQEDGEDGRHANGGNS